MWSQIQCEVVTRDIKQRLFQGESKPSNIWFTCHVFIPLLAVPTLAVWFQIVICRSLARIEANTARNCTPIGNVVREISPLGLGRRIYTAYSLTKISTRVDPLLPRRASSQNGYVMDFRRGAICRIVTFKVDEPNWIKRH